SVNQFPGIFPYLEEQQACVFHIFLLLLPNRKTFLTVLEVVKYRIVFHDNVSIMSI
uniref:Uncharacterized protein n=1 Tax=Leptobrachium leishanense TaxID=445787 RepID=A0A8C5PV05_9ANUR